MPQDTLYAVSPDTLKRLEPKPQRMIPVSENFLQMVAAFAEDVSTFTPEDEDAFTAADLVSAVDDIMRRANAV